MTELEVCLEFACHTCWRPVQLVVRCKGAVLALTTKVLARTVIKCPNCGEMIDLTFDPDGAVHDVAPYEDARLPQPSWN